MCFLMAILTDRQPDEVVGVVGKLTINLHTQPPTMPANKIAKLLGNYGLLRITIVTNSTGD